MDPDACLEQILKLARDITDTELEGEDLDVLTLAQRIQDLDQWMRNDGFLPKAWKTSHHP